MKKINARECTVKEIDVNCYKKFVNVNHDQGYAAATNIYGLFFKDKLVQLMSFGKPRFNKNYQWEIIRECTRKDCLVRGGTSKLWKYFVQNNSVRSCICYSYPHDGKFTEHYIKYCGFKNIQRAKSQKKIYFEGTWKGKKKRIDKSILERQGVDRLLKTEQGHERTNEQILLDLGFEKKYEDGLSPQVDIYFPFGVLYRIDDLTDGCFYIGMTENKEEWENNRYNGSGQRWFRHLKAHPDHDYKRTIIKSNFRTPKDLRDAEVNEIKKYVIEHDEFYLIVKAVPGLMNLAVRRQGQTYVCPECKHVNGHSKDCSRARRCPECGMTQGKHAEDCSRLIVCPECGGKNNSHYKTCSQYTHPEPCPECGSVRKHKKTCSRYVPDNREDVVCPECGAKNGNHKKACSQYIDRAVNVKPCPECGKKFGHYKKCSQYKAPDPCPECGKRYGHYATCSKFKFKRKKKPCSECGAIVGHKHFCSQVIICKECGGTNGRHKKGCSKYHDNTKSKGVE